MDIRQISHEELKVLSELEAESKFCFLSILLDESYFLAKLLSRRKTGLLT